MLSDLTTDPSWNWRDCSIQNKEFKEIHLRFLVLKSTETSYNKIQYMKLKEFFFCPYAL